MGLLTEKYNAWARHPEKYKVEQVLSEIIADLKWLDDQPEVGFNTQRIKVCRCYEPPPQKHNDRCDSCGKFYRPNN